MTMETKPKEELYLTMTVNGSPSSMLIAARTSLADVLRDRLNLTGTHLGCEHGVCGACTVMVGGIPMRSCITLAASCEGRSVTTVEGLKGPEIDAIREAFSAEHGLQCGFCTPGMLVSVFDIINRRPCITADEAALELSGNFCRCTGYLGIVRAVCKAAESLRSRDDQEDPLP